MKHMQPKTFRIVTAVLSSARFSQRGLRKMCNEEVSAGQVNKVVAELVRNGFVERSSGRAAYVLADPLGLLRYVALFRSMSERRVFTISVAAKREEVLTKLSKRGAVFCLGTAMESYTPYFRPDEVSFYADDWESTKGFLATAAGGGTRVSSYGAIGNDPLSVGPETGFTTKVRTVIDMFCDGKGVYTKPLLRELWGIEI